MILLLGVLGAALAGVTALHLRSRPRGGAAPFPSFQHLEGLAPRTRPAWPLEEPLRWVLRVLALCLVACALFLSRREERRTFVLVVEPGLAQWGEARSLVTGSSARAVALTFEGGRPAVEASASGVEAGERARRTLGGCSATEMSCLVRAALELGGDPVVVSRFAEARHTFEPLELFRYLKTAGAAGAAPGLPREERSTADAAPPRGIVRVGQGAAARIWASALELASADLPEGEGQVTVVDRMEEAAGRPGLLLLPVVAAGSSARAAALESRSDSVSGSAGAAATSTVRLTDDAALAAGAPALDLDSSLALEDDASLVAVVPPVLMRRGSTLLAAATEEDLGRWAHGPTLVALARVILFEAGRNLSLDAAPPGGTKTWKAGAAIGLSDVGPGRYEREDGRIVVNVAREASAASLPLSDADLSALGGEAVASLPGPPTPSRAPLALLLLALVARLLDGPLRSRWAVVLAFVASVASVALLVGNASFVRKVAVERKVLTRGRLSLPGSVRDGSCTQTGAPRPCVLTARASLPGDPGEGAVNALVFPKGEPRIDLLSLDLHSEIRTGEAGLLRVALDVRRAAGREVRLSVRPTSGPSSEVTTKVTSEREVLTLSLPVRSATEGISFALVRASVEGDLHGGDALVVPLVSRTHDARRLVLAAAPTWDARAAGEALAKKGPVERLTRLGTTAVLARTIGSADPPDPRDPLDRLLQDLSGIELIVLSGFAGAELSGAREAALSRFVSSGGALLFVGELPRLPSLPVPAATSTSSVGVALLPSKVTGALTTGGRSPGKEMTFLGYAAASSSLPLAGLVLGRLDGKPWIVGRGFGKGRVAAVTAPDLWRAGPDYEALLAEVVAWLEAGRAGPPAVLSPDLRTLTLGGESLHLPASAPLQKLTVDPVDPFTLLPAGRARERVLARRQRRPFLETDPEELSSLLSRYPAPGPLPRRLFARDLPPLWPAVALLLLLEVWLRRRAGRAVSS